MAFFSWQRKVQAAPSQGFVGLDFSSEGVALSFLSKKKKAGVQVNAIDYVKAFDVKTYRAAIQHFVDKHELQGCPCSVVLSPTQYSLKLFEAPNVESAELAQAMRWTVRDSMDYPIEDSVIDAFELPVARETDQAKMAYVVTTPKSTIALIKNYLTGTGLELRYIDIPEMAIRNVANALDEQEKNGIFLWLHPFGGKLVLLNDGLVAMARDLMQSFGQDASGNQATEEVNLANLALQIQRSLDYCGRVFKNNAFDKLILLPSGIDLQKVEVYLGESLEVEIRQIALEELLSFSETRTSKLTANQILSIGGGLRAFHQGTADATRN